MLSGFAVELLSLGLRDSGPGVLAVYCTVIAITNTIAILIASFP